ncbi:MAG: hypothetical protein ACREBU_00925 [Nitrososphaera sp.]
MLRGIEQNERNAQPISTQLKVRFMLGLLLGVLLSTGVALFVGGLRALFN